MIKKNVIILSAGEGKRMKSKHAKVTHKVCGKPMVQHVIDSINKIGVDDIVIVVGHKAQEVKECIKSDVLYCMQKEQKGTGHAVLCAKEYIKEDDGITLVLCGDTPLIKEDTLLNMVEFHINGNFSATILTSDFEDPTGYGRIIRDTYGNVSCIVEHKDASDKQRNIKEINSGMYCFNTKMLFNSLKDIKNNNAQGEYYLTDVIEIIKNQGGRIGAFNTADNSEILGVNSRIQLAQAEKILKNRIIEELMNEGVTFIDPENTYIDQDVKIGKDTIVYPNCIIQGSTEIKEDCIIGPNSRILNSIIHNNVEINNSVVLDSEVKSGTHVGPFAYIRPDCIIGENVKVGDFVEVKNSSIGNDTKISHLTYIGDSEVGSKVNFGCGTVTVNYDGKKKHKTIIGDNVFIGCNTNLVAPVRVNNNTYIAAGSTITDEVPEGALAIARERQLNKLGWVEKHEKEYLKEITQEENK